MEGKQPQSTPKRSYRISEIAKKAWVALAVTFAVSALTCAILAGMVTGIGPIIGFSVSVLALGIMGLNELASKYSSSLPTKLVKSINYMRAFAKDVLATVCLGPRLALPQTRFDPKKTEECNNPPILLSHAYLYTSAEFAYLRRRLNEAGYKNVFTIDYGSPFNSIEDYCEKLETKRAEIKKITRRSDIILIGHSMGGVISSEYATKRGADGSVKDVITLGSPLLGTLLGVMGFGRCARQMNYGSTYIKELNKRIENCTTSRFFHIGSTSDWLVQPYISTVVKKHKYKLFDGIGHVEYPFSDRVIDELIQYLDSQKYSSSV